MDLQLKDKVVVVTGGGRGIGAAAVRRFHEEEAIVCCLDRDAEAGTKLAGEADRIHFFEAECSRAEACQEVVEAILKRFGRLDVLVNNAGFNDSVSLERTPADFLTSLEANITPAYAMTHYAREALRQSHGAIVNVGSKVALTGQGGTSGYAAAKGGINALTREWAIAFAGDGVRVNAVLPAECLTDAYRRFFESQSRPEEVQQAIENLIPLGRRMTTPEEVADAIVFLSSGRSTHTTGQILLVDGGYTHLDRALSHDHAKWK